MAEIETATAAGVMAALANADATINGAPITGIFDNGYADGLDLVAGRRPMFTVMDSSAPSAAAGDTLVLGAASYRVVGVEPDGTGMTRLVLEAR